MDSRPQLRLVGAGEGPRGGDAARGVARENRAAAQNPLLDPADPRWVLALRARAQLQGGALPPDRRAQLMRAARAMGMRDFDATMIIAIVQDQARRGVELGGGAGTIALLAPPERERRSLTVLRWAAAIAAAVAMNAMLIRWLA
jgi:hypothetical protein